MGAVRRHMIHPHQGKQGVDLLLPGHLGAVGGDAPQGHQWGHGGVKGPAGGPAQGHSIGNQIRRLPGHIGSALPVQGINFAALPGPGQGRIQTVQLLAAGGQRLRCPVAVGCQAHIGIHGEQTQLLRLRLRAAPGQAQQQSGHYPAEQTLHSSRLPSRARISVASSANSRCPPTGMP